MADAVEPGTRAAWRRWLASNHASSDGCWVTYRKRKAAGPKDPGYEELVLEALCFGWVDSRPGTVDEDRTRLYFSPRRPGSGWAATNKARIEMLVAEGLMTPAGIAVIERAKADGSWSRIDGSESAIVPPDLMAAFARHPGSQANWEAFPLGVRKQILQWIEQARREQTRAARVEETASCAERNVRANQWRPKA